MDLDAEIERRTGHNIPDIFAQEGEDAFRRYEADVLPSRQATGRSSPAAAGHQEPGQHPRTAPERPRAVGAPPAGGVGYRRTPLSKGGAALKQLEAERTPLYEAASTVVLENYGSLTAAVDKAVQLFEADERL